jgi:hypothetical protein
LQTQFTQLNVGFDAEPNAPEPEIRVEGSRLTLTFFLKHWSGSDFREYDRGELTFAECWRFRLGPTDDEGWDRGLCRFSRIAPEWGMFYEIAGDLRLERVALDWKVLDVEHAKGSRHYLFYFRDETFECDAGSWSFRVQRASDADVERICHDGQTITTAKAPCSR